MLVFLLPLQLAVTTPVPARDSVALLDQMKGAGFTFIMRWRDAVLADEKQTKPAALRPMGVLQSVAVATMAATHGAAPGVSTAPPSHGTVVEAIPADRTNWLSPSTRHPAGKLGCFVEYTNAMDIDQHDIRAHIIKAPRLDLSFCPIWSATPPAALDPALLDRQLSEAGLAKVRALRDQYLGRLDSAAHVMPGDHWIAGQRIRFALEQDDAQKARRLISECRAEAWWCSALAGYVAYEAGDRTEAAAHFARAHAAMPLDVRCDWDDIGPLLIYSERQAYQALPCTRRDSINAVAWWLADPLFLEPGNDRFDEQMARRTAVALHEDAEIDLWTDWRTSYQGPAFRESTLRYGAIRWTTHDRAFWPGEAQVHRALTDYTASRVYYLDPRDSNHMIMPYRDPIPFHSGDTKATFLGLAGSATYAGPGFHTVPTLRAALDPTRISMADWDLSPARDGGAHWDGSWWAPEFYTRGPNPIVPLESQIAMFRRGPTAMVAAAMQWDTLAYPFLPPRGSMTAGVVAMSGPGATPAGGRWAMTADAMHGVAVALPSGPTVVSLEMMPRAGTVGTSGRVRVGATVPPTLTALLPGAFALSDPVLVHPEGFGASATLDDAVVHMFGTTRLRDPQRVAVYWEAYGLSDHDTVSVALGVIRHDAANVLRRAAATVGIGTVGDDSLVARWTEPRPNDPSTITDGGVTIRPRSLVLDLSAMAAGDYSLDVIITRGATTVHARRDLTIARR